MSEGNLLFGIPRAQSALSTLELFGAQGMENLTPSPTPNLLAANRGEIAIRIIRSAHELGLKAISVYSYEDRLSPHRYKADESFQIGPQGKFTPVGTLSYM